MLHPQSWSILPPLLHVLVVALEALGPHLPASLPLNWKENCLKMELRLTSLYFQAWQRHGIHGSSGHGLGEWVGACILAILWVRSQSGPGQGTAAWYPIACPPPWPVEESRQPTGAPGSAEGRWKHARAGQGSKEAYAGQWLYFPINKTRPCLPHSPPH